MGVSNLVAAPAVPAARPTVAPPITVSNRVVKTWKCQDCGAEFSTKWLVQRHVKNVHLKEKPFECPHPGCHKRFFRKVHAEQHAQIHECVRAIAACVTVCVTV